MAATDFQFHVPVSAFKKAGDDRMWIGGICSDAGVDQEDETVIQEGLDFAPFLSTGWFNDNHGKKTTDVLGYPTEDGARLFRRGDVLPDGQVAQSDGWWVEGYMVDTPKAREVYDLANALRGTPRRLGFSVEGKVLRRAPGDRKRVTRALVRNVAITHCPVNPRTELQTLAKALTAGAAIDAPGPGAGDGFPLRTESLDDGEDAIAKAVDADFALTEAEYIGSWAGATSAALGRESERSQFTSEEAHAIIRARRPDLADHHVAAIVRSAQGAS